MANYSANIQLVVQGQDRLKYVLNSVERLNTILSRLKPINLLAPGGGSGADVIGQAKKQLDDFSRAIVNFKPEGIQKRARELSNTLAGSAAQADALTIALENVGLKTGGFSKQAAEVKNYALALEQARRNTERLNTLSQQVQRGARIQTIAQRFNVSPAAVEERLNNLRDIRYAKDRKAEAERYIALKREEDFEVRLQRIRERNAAIQATQAAQLERSKALRSRLGGALSNAAIGGAFPLLFGQGAGAAAGGAIGGLVGGAFGGVGGFAGSLIGTLLGDIASRGKAVKQLAEDIGFSAQQTKELAAAFKVANTDVEKFTAVIQNIRGVGLALEDQAKAVQLVTRLTEIYGGSFEKTGNAITSALESGKVTQATLNQLTSQGITIQDALAKKYGVSRDAILKMAKDGNITVQALIDTLVQLGNEGETAATKPKTAFEQFTTALGKTGTAVANLATQIGKTLGPVLDAILIKATTVLNAINQALAAGSISTQQKQAAKGRAEQIVQSQAGFLPGGPFGAGTVTIKYGQKTYKGSASGVVSQITNDLINAEVQKATGTPFAAKQPLTSFTVPSQATPSGGSKGPKPPEDRSAQLREDLEAMKLISTTQDGIRDALFEGNKELAIRLEYDQKIADINRDTAKALLNANYESEKTVIRAQEIVRIKDAQLERDDQLRELARNINDIITNTLDDLRGGISWDDTGMREIFDMRLPDALDEISQNIKDLADPANQIIGAATAIGDAFANSFKGIVSGAVSARQGLADFFKSVGDYFIDMAARIAAEALKLQAIQLLQGLLSPLLGSFGVGSMSLPGLQGAGALSSGPMFAGGAFAEGGFVTGPTRALIGEGGEPEYVIPASKMRTAMGRYSAGARGSSVVSGTGGQVSGETNGSAATMEPIDVRYSVERINNVDYVTADQFQRGMAQAAQQGAIQGERRAMRTLQNSAATRRRISV